MKIKTDRTKAFKLLAILSFASFLLAIGLRMTAANSSAIKSTEMVDLVGEQRDLKKNISLLKLEISEVSSLSFVEESAKNLGFDKYNGSPSVISSAIFAAATPL